jgi:cation diffusion facilitator family transporter
MASGSTGVVLAALFANGAIAILKFVGFLLTGSPSMLSETYHSISDTGNQVFLLIGIRYSDKSASRGHPFGYGKAQFFYAFLVSVLLFGIAGWESLNHGIHAIQTAGNTEIGEFTVPVIGGTYETFWLNVAVLLAAIAFETYAFAKANKELQSQMDEFGWGSIREAFGKTSDATTLTAFTEDAIALSGAAIALVGVTLTRYTGNGIFDAITAAIIGLLLMGFAIALAWENKRLLLGQSLARDAEDELETVVTDHPSVTNLDGFRSVFFGPQKAMVAADVSFESDLTTGQVDDAITEIEKRLKETDSRVTVVYIEPEI